MEIACALLCDAATVREGLLHVLGGGVTRVNSPQFPAPMNTALALEISVHPTEGGNDHQLQILVQTEDGSRIAELGAAFNVSADPSGDTQPGEQFNVPLVVPLQMVGLPVAGGYSVEILIDGTHRRSIAFWAVLHAQP